MVPLITDMIAVIFYLRELNIYQNRLFRTVVSNRWEIQAFLVGIDVNLYKNHKFIYTETQTTIAVTSSLLWTAYVDNIIVHIYHSSRPSSSMTHNRALAEYWWLRDEKVYVAVKLSTIRRPRDIKSTVQCAHI